MIVLNISKTIQWFGCQKSSWYLNDECICIHIHFFSL